jgi:hypothetical protein
VTITTDEILTANGVVLNTLAYNVGSLTGRLRTPARRGDNVTVPGRHGAIRTPNKRFDQGEIVLPMWVVGADEDGLVPAFGPGRDQLFANVDMLTRIFSTETVDLVHTLPDGSQRRLLGEPSEAIDFTSMAGGGRAEFAVTLRVPGAFWTDIADVSASFAGEGAWSVAEFDGATAPMDELAVTFTGGTNPRVQAGNVWLQYSAVLAATESITLDCATWTLSGGGGLVPDYSRVDHAGDGRWFVLPPGVTSSTPSVEVSQTGIGAMTTQFIGRRKYLIG